MESGVFLLHRVWESKFVKVRTLWTWEVDPIIQSMVLINNPTKRALLKMCETLPCCKFIFIPLITSGGFSNVVVFFRVLCVLFFMNL